MAYTTVNKCTANFNTKLYTGNASTQAITGVGFQPDLIWIKNRSTNNSHVWTDAVRGVSSTMYSNSNGAQDTGSTNVGSFDSDGFTLGSNGGTNGNGNNVASWNWKANGAGSANSDGTISSTVSANTASGFSIVKWTGTGATGTIGHGLGKAPHVIIVKQYNGTRDWVVGSGEFGWTKYQYLNSTQVSNTGNFFNDTAPTSSVFSVVNDSGVNGNGNYYIAYCFAPTTGFSQMGWYRGSGQDQGPYITCSFKPKIVFIKNTEQGGDDWHIFDDQRSASGGGNIIKYRLFPNNNSAETTTSNMGFDFYSNGFQVTDNLGAINNFNEGIWYLAFGQSLVGSNNIPATAR